MMNIVYFFPKRFEIINVSTETHQIHLFIKSAECCLCIYCFDAKFKVCVLDVEGDTPDCPIVRYRSVKEDKTKFKMISKFFAKLCEIFVR